MEAWIAIYYDGNYTKAKFLEFEIAPEGWPITAQNEQVAADCESITAIVQVNGFMTSAKTEMRWTVPLIYLDNGTGYLEAADLGQNEGQC